MNSEINQKIKQLRHLLVLECERRREIGRPDDRFELMCNTAVLIERLMAQMMDKDDANT